MEKWAKLFESNGFQVLVTKEYDEDDDFPKVSFAVRIDGAELSLGPVFKGDNGEEQRDKMFEGVDQETVDGFTQPLIGCKTTLEAVKRFK